MKAMTRTWLFLGLAALAVPFAGCGGGGGGGGGPSCLDQQYATVAWSIEDQFGNPLSCQAAGASTVILNFGNLAPYSFPCTAYTGATEAGLPPGNYDFSMQLLAPDNTILSDTSVGNPPIAYPIYSCAVDDIPGVVFGI